MDIQFDEKKLVDFLINELKKSGLKFRIKSPNEKGGFFYTENGEKKELSENIFIKRSIKYENISHSTEYEKQNLIPIMDICADGNEREVDILEMTNNLSVIPCEANLDEKSYETIEYFDLKDNNSYLSIFMFSSSLEYAA